MKKVSTHPGKAEQENFTAETEPSDWIWEIATAGIACWMKRATYN